MSVFVPHVIVLAGQLMKKSLTPDQAKAYAAQPVGISNWLLYIITMS